MYNSTFNKDKLGIIDGTLLPVNTYTKVASYKVSAKEFVSLGQGKNETQEGALGRIFGDLKDDTNANIDGLVRFSVWTPSNHPKGMMIELHTNQLRTDINDRTKQYPLPESWFKWVTQDDQIVIEVMPETQATLSKANSTLYVDVTLAYKG